MRKRSRRVALCIVGAAAFSLAGCREEQVEAQAYPDLQSCEDAAARDGLLSSDECAEAFAEARDLHVEAAPRYDSIAVCEEQHGEGNCGSEEQVAGTGGSGIFMPLLAGYLIGNMLGGRGMARAQPLYRTPDGRFTDAGRSSVFSSNTGKARMSSAQFARPATTMGQAPMSRAAAASRGGFGSTGGARGFGG
ncbi:uncharacterized protein YgiB involved in biofilm formation [Palleronia aestuarii]|uniref:Uncharacterized protein YgiB involved in biofilm formation n=1 Tax=Palleronia aestuarii TaxID=568105 RepID=A0A2W7N5X1_9RHOB|nr:DUF1190 domain-containing protein [Palleronia aestuarii]PZX15805.1 uncharacterized protein YgiB involved in biofilm formation [Palleronia aestuarii]